MKKTAPQTIASIVAVIVTVIALSSSCRKPEKDSGFILSDYIPDMVLEDAGGYFAIDINQDGTDDIKAFNIVPTINGQVQSYTVRGFLAIDTVNCKIGFSQDILYSIDETLSWCDSICLTNRKDLFYFLAIKIKNGEDTNYAWLQYSISDGNSIKSHMQQNLIIDKWAYCKIPNRKIMTRQEKIE